MANLGGALKKADFFGTMQGVQARVQAIKKAENENKLFAKEEQRLATPVNMTGGIITIKL